MRVAVIGHLEWVEFARVTRVPRAGEIVHSQGSFAEPAGGGAVAAVQLARLGGECTFYTALGDDGLAAHAMDRLEALGVGVEAAIRSGKPTRRAFTFIDDTAERTITTLGERLEPGIDDPLPWDELESMAAVYFTAGDAESLRAARAAGTLVATTRISERLVAATVALDAAVGSAGDPGERYRPLQPPPRYVVATAGARGGTWLGAGAERGTWSPAPVPGPAVDAYGAGDSFAAGLTYALGEGRGIGSALALAARCGATCITGHGPYEHQLSRADLEP